MSQTLEKAKYAPIALTDETAEMSDYVRGAAGRKAIDRGLADIRRGRIFTGKNALALELRRRASNRRA